jgi:hypothetical protein
MNAPSSGSISLHAALQVKQILYFNPFDKDNFACAASTSISCGRAMPTGRTNARPMTGYAKQSIAPAREGSDCFVAPLRNGCSSKKPRRVPGLCCSLESYFSDLNQSSTSLWIWSLA